MTNKPTRADRKYDLEERTGEFGEEIIRFCQSVPKNEITRPLINQLIKCGTSVGANFCEADDAESKADFKHKIGICKKESRETKHFLRMFLTATKENTEDIKKLLNEDRELNLIFNSIYNKLK